MAPINPGNIMMQLNQSQNYYNVGSITQPQRESLKNQLSQILNQFLETKEKKEITSKDLENLYVQKPMGM